MLPADEWDGIPNNSQFTLRLSGNTASCVSRAAVFKGDQQIATWAHADLVAGQSVTLLAQHNYHVELGMLFGTNGTVTVDAAPSAPNGNIWGTPYQQTATGVNGDSESADFWLTTVL